MIKPDELYEITVTGANIKYYRTLYPDVKLMTKIKVTGNELPSSSHMKIKFICDFCGAEYERVVYSEKRSGLVNACPLCRTKKTIVTCNERYGVNHPMQDYNIHKKSVEGHINNFGNYRKNCDFVNGVPVSKVQKEICERLQNFQLNYLEDGYYYDMFNSIKNLVIEYNGKGHDLQVKFGKITQEDFNQRESTRIERIMARHNLLIIEDPHDRFVHPKNFLKYFPLINQAVENPLNYNIITIK